VCYRSTVIHLFLLLAALQPAAQDVVRLKDGTTRSGRIVSETAGEITLETLIQGAKSQVAGSAKVTDDNMGTEWGEGP